MVRADHSGRRHLNVTQSLARLAGQFRDDVASAEEAVLVDGATRLRLRLPGGRSIDYASEAGRATRDERLGEAQERREQFILPETMRVAFAVERDRPAFAATATLAAENDAAESERTKEARSGWRVEAAVGRALRFSHNSLAADEEPPTSKKDPRP
jgi:hypothetical protein